MRLLRIGALLLLLGVAQRCSAFAQEQEIDISRQTVTSSADLADTTAGPHGGKVIRRDRFILETVFDPDGIRVYLADTSGLPLKPEDAKGQCTFVRDSGGIQRLAFVLKRDHGKQPARWRSREFKRGHHLFAPYDFSLVPDGGIRLRIEFSGLPGQTTSTVGCSLPVVLTRLRGWVCRGHQERIFPEYKNHPLCEKRYLVEAPFLYQCPNHAHSRAHRPSKCPLCASERVPTRQSTQPILAPREPLLRKP